LYPINVETSEPIRPLQDPKEVLWMLRILKKIVSKNKKFGKILKNPRKNNMNLGIFCFLFLFYIVQRKDAH